jgi:hypothetical protein
VLRNPTRKLEERLEKAVLSFQILMRYYHLSVFPYGIGIIKRYSAKVTSCITFTEDCESETEGSWSI